MNTLIRSISGIRGIVGDSLVPQTVLTYVSAFARLCEGGPIVLGYDGRPHGRILMDVARAALQFHGVEVVDGRGTFDEVAERVSVVVDNAFKGMR